MKRINFFNLVVGLLGIGILILGFNAQEVLADINTVDFFYDGSGQRIYKGVNGGEHTYYISPGVEVVIASDGTTSWRKNYYFSGKLVAVKDNSQGSERVNYTHQDHLGSTSLVTSNTGQVVSQQVYYPYGSTRTLSGTLPTERAYTGQISDTDLTGLYYYNARYYNPQIAKFTQADSQGDALNKYAYVGNNPIIFTDPTGNMVVSDGGGGGLPTRRIPGPLSRPTRGGSKAAVPCTNCHHDPFDSTRVGPAYTSDPEEYMYGRFSLGLSHLYENINFMSLYLNDSEITPFLLFDEWLTGTGPRKRSFIGGDLMTDILRQHSWIDNVRFYIKDQIKEYSDYSINGKSNYSLRGVMGVSNYLADISGNPLRNSNLAVVFLGSYSLEYYITNVDKDSNTIEVIFHAKNKSDLGSLSHVPVIGYTDIWRENVAPFLNNLVKEGPLSKTSQEFWWKETIFIGGE
ncbi:hypothetical protein A3D01_00010 [Candidatus Woesebacteria bacterium RIFCSPHIGHO2_02_FULL_39_13]|uniref:Teneurin-like YD-shell domain-containing protein n=1 Tax=Candidatus Woesebacteria bacterium RIFCSPHIGHO2_02_FULL_39_13 TaxID=1802505 RepID=A0A1F7Z3V0_9BACT|nr:MAG: hypothetical protein A2692_04185 [Candidatus Woesebacteria bacterium RIFCSPHIGHO2_01_FULL_39_95]OGM34104.1 MAG: hypothetical protein A3D01_00010 [Candidatus Woesebacteria bacterium RIFCSPHIGHO2_02_FULL_39_13]OGM36216.1 MAG: hypothetical protein A3E13_02420 [Candidatus Woesebacteria bacterium RIFCSPHIGHO2_12_FULL_40_20]